MSFLLELRYLDPTPQSQKLEESSFTETPGYIYSSSELDPPYTIIHIQGSLEFVRTIEGRSRYSHFGYAMVNLGDINRDGFDGKLKSEGIIT